MTLSNKGGRSPNSFFLFWQELGAVNLNSFKTGFLIFAGNFVQGLNDFIEFIYFVG